MTNRADRSRPTVGAAPFVARSLLFGAATRAGFVDKVLAVGADVGILDLEAAVPESAKDAARAVLVEQRPGAIERPGTRLLVRVNDLRTEHFVDDLRAAAESGVDGIVAPTLESADHVHFVRGAMAMTSLADGVLVGGIETVRGLRNADDICAAGLDAVYFGAEDFATDLGGVRSPSNVDVAVARAQLVWSARLAGITALDQVVSDYRDLDRFAAESADARRLGYAGKLCIHPDQVGLANEAFGVSEAELERAVALVAAAEAAAAQGIGVITFEGAMVDEPIVVRARAVIAAAARRSDGSAL